ncbi:MAG TPA: ImmA/IrrE family metallo-endopeptidase [Armatimonadota bacterium]
MTPSPAEQLDRTLDDFLGRWSRVDHRNLPAFARRAAGYFALPPPPRRGADCLDALGVLVSRESLPPGVWAVWTVERGRYHIRISPFLSGPRGNFTLWHECFEIMAARPSFPTPLPRRAVERLADRFAACVTMPEVDVLAALQQMPHSGDKSDVLAARFAVSVTALRRRLRELGLLGSSRFGAFRALPAWEGPFDPAGSWVT